MLVIDLSPKQYIDKTTISYIALKNNPGLILDWIILVADWGLQPVSDLELILN